MSISSTPTTTPDPTSPPADYVFGDGYNAGNAILAGSNNKIFNSRRCTVINGCGNLIGEKYNTHIIGDFVSPRDQNNISNGGYPKNGNNFEPDELLNNAFYIGCLNGLHSYGDVVAFSSSDERLKDNISIIIDPLGKVLRLDAVEFDWNDKQEVYKGHDIGIIAQQVEEVAPELVTTRSNGYKAVKYEKLTALLVGAIKEQQKQIDFLEKRVESLERRSSH